MPKAKKIATTLKNVLTNNCMIGILDRKRDILPLIDEIDSFWNVDLFQRKPTPAEFDDAGNLIKCTSLDLATFLYSLWDRGAMINIPTYESWRPTTIKEGQIITSKENRHGKITGLTSNANIFSFGVRILDQNVMSTDSSGFPRAFNLTGPKGEWFPGWKTIQFMPTAKENTWLTESKIFDNNKITFENFVHPNRWISFFGQYYFMTKATIDRLKEEKSYLQKLKTSMLEIGLKLPESEEDNFTKFDSKSKTEPGDPLIVECLEVKVDVPEYDNCYPEYPMTSEGLLQVWTKLKAIRRAQEKFSFVCRTIEYAVYSQDRFDTFPAWIKDVKWEEGYKEGPRSRTLYRRLKLIQPVPFEKSISLRYRIYQKTEYVKKGYDISKL